jgi:hypothetical protein
MIIEKATKTFPDASGLEYAEVDLVKTRNSLNIASISTLLDKPFRPDAPAVTGSGLIEIFFRENDFIY